MKPPNHGTYQIWYHGKTHAVSVESVATHKVYQMTRKRPEFWKNKPGVQLHIDHPRTTRNGDVIVDPTCGAWKVERDGFLAVEPPAPVRRRIERGGHRAPAYPAPQGMDGGHAAGRGEG